MLRQVYLALTLACFAALASSTRELVLTSGLDALNKIEKEAQKLDSLGALYSLEKPISSFNDKDLERLIVLEKVKTVNEIIKKTWKPKSTNFTLPGWSDTTVDLFVYMDPVVSDLRSTKLEDLSDLKYHVIPVDSLKAEYSHWPQTDPIFVGTRLRIPYRARLTKFDFGQESAVHTSSIFFSEDRVLKSKQIYDEIKNDSLNQAKVKLDKESAKEINLLSLKLDKTYISQIIPLIIFGLSAYLLIHLQNFQIDRKSLDRIAFVPFYNSRNSKIATAILLYNLPVLTILYSIAAFRPDQFLGLLSFTLLGLQFIVTALTANSVDEIKTEIHRVPPFH